MAVATGKCNLFRYCDTVYWCKRAMSGLFLDLGCSAELCMAMLKKRSLYPHWHYENHRVKVHVTALLNGIATEVQSSSYHPQIWLLSPTVYKDGSGLENEPTDFYDTFFQANSLAVVYMGDRNEIHYGSLYIINDDMSILPTMLGMTSYAHASLLEPEIPERLAERVLAHRKKFWTLSALNKRNRDGGRDTDDGAERFYTTLAPASHVVCSPNIMAQTV